MPSTGVETSPADSARADREADPGAFSPFAERVLFGALALLTLVLFAQLLEYGYGRDQAIYSLIADAMLRGEAPYRDAWDFKPPGIYAVYAFARAAFGGSFGAVRVLEVLALISLFPAFAIFSKRHVASARAGLLCGAVAILAYVPIEFWYTGQPEGFGGVALAWALVFTTYEPPAGAGQVGERRQLAAWACAAALYSIAALLKPPLGGGILVSFAFVVAGRRPTAISHGWAGALAAPTFAFAVGGALPVLATLAYFAALGALPELYSALFVFAPGYTAIGLADSSAWLLLGRTLREWLLLTAPFNFVGLVALALLPPLSARERLGSLHVLGVVAISLLGIALQAKFFLYHYAAVLLLSALLAGWGYWKLWIRARRSALASLVFAAALVGIAFDLVPGLPEMRVFWTRSALRLEAHSKPELRIPYRDRLHQFGDVDAGSNRRAADWLIANTPADSRLFVWGFEPAIYHLSGRRPASRYIYNVPQRSEWAQAESRRILIEELTAAPPAAIVVVHRDALPWVTGNSLDSATALTTFPDLQRLLREEYQQAWRTGDLQVLLRHDSASPSADAH
jgi:hypothetical protein